MNSSNIKILGQVSAPITEKILNQYADCYSLIGSIGFWVDYSNYKVDLGSVINKIVIEEIVYKTKGTLMFVTDSSLLDLKFIDVGYKSIVFINFDSKQSFLTRINILHDWYDKKNINPSIIFEISQLLPPESFRVVKDK